MKESGTSPDGQDGQPPNLPATTTAADRKKIRKYEARIEHLLFSAERTSQHWEQQVRTMDAILSRLDGLTQALERTAERHHDPQGSAGPGTDRRSGPADADQRWFLRHLGLVVGLLIGALALATAYLLFVRG